MLHLELTSPGRYRPVELNAPGDGNLAFGGHLLALLVIAATEAVEGRRLTSLHTVFGRGVRVDEDVSFETEVIALGRNAASARVAVRQAGTTCAEALAVALAPQDIALSHADSPPRVGLPADATPLPTILDAIEMRVVGDVELSDERAQDDRPLSVWIRPVTRPTSVTDAQAMIAYASEPNLLGTALLPHAGWSQAGAFTDFIPAVCSHTMHFHATPPLDGGWWLFVLESPHLAVGRVFGRGDVFAEDGTLLASITQENLVRLPPTQSAKR